MPIFSNSRTEAITVWACGGWRVMQDFNDPSQGQFERKSIKFLASAEYLRWRMRAWEPGWPPVQGFGCVFEVSHRTGPPFFDDGRTHRRHPSCHPPVITNDTGTTNPIAAAPTVSC